MNEYERKVEKILKGHITKYKRFVKKPVVIEAIQWNGNNKKDIDEFVGEELQDTYGGEILCIETLEGEHQAKIGDWIIKGVKGEFYPCKPDIFEQTYSRIDD